MFNVVLLSGIIILGIRILIAQLYYSDLGFKVVKTDEKFRYALSLSPFTSKNFNEGYTYEYNGEQITQWKNWNNYIRKKEPQKCMFVLQQKKV